MALSAKIDRRQTASLPTLWGADGVANPFPRYVEMRRNGPVTQIQTPEGVKGVAGPEVWAITHYNEISDALKGSRFTVDGRAVGRPFLPPVQQWLMNLFSMGGDAIIMVDGAKHARLRALVQKAFAPRAIEQLHAYIDNTCEQLLDAASAKGTVDLIEAFALPLPLMVISEMLGVPEEHRNKFRKLAEPMLDLASLSGNPAGAAVSLFLLRRYIGQLIKLRRHEPDGRLLSTLIEAEEAGDRLSESEVVVMIFLLLFAGHETTVNLIGNGVLALLENPEQLNLLHAHPDLASSAVEESLRFAPPIEFGSPRFALEDVTYGNVTIPRGSSVIALLSSGNRDDAFFANPDRMDITRENNRHLTFGLGAHFCIGSPLARMEGVTAFRALTQRFPNMALAAKSSDLKWWNKIGLRGLLSLPVRLR